MRIDYHTHHDRCGHAKGSLRDMIEAATAAGIGQLGLSDHSPFFGAKEDHPEPGMTMARSEFPRYVDEIIQLREEYRDRIDIRLGVESDYLQGLMELYGHIYAKYPLDYVIGSVHYFGFHNYHVFDRRRWQQADLDVDREYEQYIHLVQEAARRGNFDVLGHIDAVKGLGAVPSRSFAALWDETADVIAQAGVAVEINTSGLRKRSNAWFPAADILERLHRLRVPFTFGSDAHSPEELLHDWESVADFLLSIGVKELATFKRRKRGMIPLVR